MYSKYNYIKDYNIISTKSIEDLELLGDLAFNPEEVEVVTDHSMRAIDLVPEREDVYVNNGYIIFDVKNFVNSIHVVFGLYERDFEIVLDNNFNIVDVKYLNYANKFSADEILYILNNLYINYDYLEDNKKLIKEV